MSYPHLVLTEDAAEPSKRPRDMVVDDLVCARSCLADGNGGRAGALALEHF
jgi:hypothetical protein